MTNDKKTNWDLYYSKPTSASSFTRKITERIILMSIRKYFGNQSIQKICELGGANSCFYGAIRKCYPDVLYTIVDNNKKGLELFKEKYKNNAKYHLINQDLLNLTEYPANNDVVYSVGLIEHFNKKQTAEIIRDHFYCAKPGALVLITFPTPTVLYKLVRMAAEIIGVWKFHDERPLFINDVVNEVKKYGVVQNSFINWGAILTQGVVIVKTNTYGEITKNIVIGEV